MRKELHQVRRPIQERGVGMRTRISESRCKKMRVGQPGGCTCSTGSCKQQIRAKARRMPVQITKKEEITESGGCGLMVDGEREPGIGRTGTLYYDATSVAVP